MTATYTLASGANLDKTRILIPDKTLTGLTPTGGVYTLTTYTFTDEEIADFLTLESDDPYRAAALALESVIGAGAQSGGRVSGLGYSIDDTAGYDLLMRRIAWLRSHGTDAGITFVAANYTGTDSTDEFGRSESWW